MRIQAQTHVPYSPPTPRASSSKSEVEQALDRLEICLTDTAQSRADAVSSSGALQGYEPECKSIKFDRADRDVSAHGVALKGKTDSAAPTSERGLQLSQGVKLGGDEIKARIDKALAELSPAEAAARRHLETAQRDAQFLIESSMPHLTVSYKHAHRQSQEELSPYLVEVMEDAPGRDVGRFADDIKGLFGESISNYRQGELGGKFVVEDLTKIKSSLILARDKMK